MLNPMTTQGRETLTQTRIPTLVLPHRYLSMKREEKKKKGCEAPPVEFKLVKSPQE